ncbi:flippase [Rossellomorea vietnamensis]|uniref:Flippase n=1 Tax=Rossellomorea vietnamensis TaxID=218284 RepID=A0A5D4M3N0_9BACI|nr:flippase [Rossellomorea vietnamensis]TYR95913.1 flippase [Rossellomorea vietnamensis]
MGKSITKNLMYNLILRIVTMVLPLVTLPYVSRILGAEGVGIYSYTYSITQYFIILGTVGLTLYGNRQIAYTRDDQEKMSRTFWSIFLLRIITTGLATLIYASIFWNSENYNIVFMLQTVLIIAAMLDISWLYLGREDFKKTVLVNLSVKIVGVILIFILVRDSNDLYLYIIINVLMLLLASLSLWYYLPSTVKMVKPKISDISEHITPALQLFVPQIAIQVYVLLDKTMIGVLSNVEQVGFYAQSEKLIKAGLALVTALGTVMMPRMSNIFANGDTKTMIKYLNISLKAVAFIAVPMSVGLASLSSEFVPWFLGTEFEPAIILMVVLSPILFFIAMSNVMGTQFLLPSNRTKEFTISVTIGAVVNLTMNFILIPEFGALGACIATIIAEISVTSIQYYYLRNELRLKDFYLGFSKYLIAALFMFIIIKPLGLLMGVGISTTITQFILGVSIYWLVLTLLKEEINNMLVKKISMRLKIGRS